MDAKQLQNERDRIINYLFVLFGLYLIVAVVFMHFIENFELFIGFSGVMFVMGGMIKLFLIDNCNHSKYQKW